MNMENIQTGLRIPSELNERVEKIAIDTNISKNSALKMLVSIGVAVLEKSQVNLSAESLREIFQSPR